MICKNNKTGHNFNYEFVSENLVNIWNPDPSFGTNGYSDIISYETWINDFTIIDKWRTITNNY